MSNPSIQLYKSLKQLNKAQFSEVCLYLQEQYGYDLSYVDLNKAPSESANQLIEFIKQSSQELSYLSEIIDKVAPQKKSKINSPDLRPYLINRTDQKIQLRQEIRNHNKQYPLLCVIHGDKYQCHDRFFDRLVQYDLPKLTLVSDNEIPCDFLPCRFDKGVDIWHQEILEKFSEKLFCSDNSSEILDAIVGEKRPMLFYTSMCTDNWTQFGGIELVQEFIKFWADWAFPPHHNHLLLICLFFNYTVEPSNFWNRWRKKTSINDQIRQELEDIKFDEFGVKGIVLPELENIEKQEVEDWVREHLRNCLEIFKPEIENLFKSSNEKKTMEYLVEKINPILKEHCT